MHDRGKRFCQQQEEYELDLSLSSAEVVKTAVISSGKQMQKALQNINECGDEQVEQMSQCPGFAAVMQQGEIPGQRYWPGAAILPKRVLQLSTDVFIRVIYSSDELTRSSITKGSYHTSFPENNETLLHASFRVRGSFLVVTCPRCCCCWSVGFWTQAQV